MLKDVNKFEQAFVIVADAKRDVKSHAIQVAQSAISKLIDVINANLETPLPSFVIYGYTPEWNDGEECEHSSQVGVPHIDYQASTWGGGLVYDDVLENDERYAELFPEFDQYDDAYQHACAVRDGLTPKLLVYKTEEEKTALYDVLNLIDQIVQLIVSTNYQVVCKRQPDGSYPVKITDIEPPY